MTSLVYVMLAITTLFFVMLLVKESFDRKKKKFCAICAAIVLTWITLLVLNWVGKFDNKILIALLMGESILGIFYLVESKVREELKLFRLPFLLSLMLIGYFLITFEKLFVETIFLVALWIIFLFIYSYRNNKNLNSFVNKIVECCKRW